MRVWYERRRYHFRYGREFYERGYHAKLDEVSGGQAARLEYWESFGYRARLMTVCDALDRHVSLPKAAQYLEVACMYGKTAFWVADRYPQLEVWMFDFAETFVERCRAMNPIGSRLHVWRGECTDIRLGPSSFDQFFDFATCLDVTEHLPEDVYQAMLAELARVVRPGGHLLLMQGNTVQVEHIHVLPEDRLIGDVVQAGFKWLATLPERHHLFAR